MGDCETEEEGTRHDGKKEKGDKDEACGKGEDEGNKEIKGQEDDEEGRKEMSSTPKV